MKNVSDQVAVSPISMPTSKSAEIDIDREPLPSSNTGVQTPADEQTANVGLVDWLSYTEHPADPQDGAQAIMRRLYPGRDWRLGPHNGFEHGRQFADTCVLWNTAVNPCVHVKISGNACRMLEYYGQITDWSQFLRDIITAGARITRIDLAIDDRSGLLQMDDIRASGMAGDFVSRLRMHRPEVEYDRNNGNKQISDGYIFGSRNSDTQLRIYDKALEQKTKGPWIRCEIQFRDERAQAAAEMIATSGLSGVPGLMRSCVDFKCPAPSKRRDRWVTTEWWTQFLGNTAKLRLGINPKNIQLDRDKKFMMRMASVLARVDRDCGSEYLECVLKEGYRRLG